MTPVHALVPAAGSGARFAASRAGEGGKLFVEVDGRPVLGWTLAALLRSDAVASVTVALSADRRTAPSLPGGASDREVRHQLVGAHPGAGERLRLVAGGAHRQESVARCLEASPAGDDDLVLVHDGARPCLHPEDLDRVVAAARGHGAAVLGRPVTDTLQRVRDGWVEGVVDRSGLFRAETPQVARRRDLERALQLAAGDGWRATDEAGLLARAGVRVRAVEARHANPKLTVEADLELLASLLRRRRDPERAAAG